MKPNGSPPKLFLRFFRWYCHPKLQDYIEGDLMEVHAKRLKKSGKRVADIRFVFDVLLLFRPGIIRPVEGYKNLNQYDMYKSYFKIGWRNLVRDKGYSLINVGGLALGMTVAILIGLWVYDELSFNQYHKNYDRIAQVYSESLILKQELLVFVNHSGFPWGRQSGVTINSTSARFDGLVARRLYTVR